MNGLPSNLEISKVLQEFLAGMCPVAQLEASLSDCLTLDLASAPLQREVLVHGFDDQAIAITVRKHHVVAMLERCLAGEVSEIELSNWAFLVFALAAFVPEGQNEEERRENGERPVWQVLQRLATPQIFAPLDLETMRGYLAWIRDSGQSEESAARIARTCSDLAAPAVLSVDLNAFDREQVGQALEEMGYFVARVDRFAVHDKRSLLDAFDRACGFPDWFGANWDAMMDCLVDLYWAPAKGYVLVGPDLTELDATERQILFEIVREASQLWKRAGIPFKLLVPSGSA